MSLLKPMWRKSQTNTQKLASPLTSDQVNEFNERGFLIVDLGFEPDLIDQTIKDMQFLYPARKAGEMYPPGTRIQDAWQNSEAAFNIATNPLALACLKQLYGREAKAFQTLNFPVGTQQKPHSDTIHFNSMPSGYMAGVWLALEDVTMDNGPLVYYPGSHKLPEYNMQDVGAGIGYEHYRAYEAFIENVIKESGIEPFYGEMKKGEVLIWHSNLIHGGSKRRNPASTRHSQVTHYYFEGCKYYTPMTSTETEITWRNPQWISKEPVSLYQHSRNMLTRFKRLIKSKIA